MKKVIRVGSRESRLAMVQTEWVIHEVGKKFPTLQFEIVPMKTTGDIILDKTLDKIGGKGLFIKELEQAMLDGAIDMAVHSMKDLPALLHPELTISAISAREDPRDVLISGNGMKLDELGDGAVLGTSSARREVQILDLRPDVQVKTLRGNVLTRLKKLDDGEYDAVILALAGLKRLGLKDRASQYFSVESIIPAVGQGALGIETRKGADVEFLLESVHDEKTFREVSAERAYMIELDGGCSAPIAAYADIEGDRMKLIGIYAREDKTGLCRAETEGDSNDAVMLGKKLAELIRKKMKPAG